MRKKVWTREKKKHPNFKFGNCSYRVDAAIDHNHRAKRLKSHVLICTIHVHVPCTIHVCICINTCFELFHNKL